MSDSQPIESPPSPKHQSRFGLLHLLAFIAISAVFSAALFHENEWLRAILGTLTVTSILNSILAALFAKGERRVFALSYFIGALICPIAAYSYMASLPFLLTSKLLEFIQAISPGEFNSVNFYTIAVIFWIQFTCITSGYMGLAWYRASHS